MLTLRSKLADTIPVEVDGLTPEVLRGKSLAEIDQLPVWQGNRQVALSALFETSGDPSDGILRFEGPLTHVHRIGQGMTDGEIHVAGPVGRHVGSQMRGGKIVVQGDAGDHLAMAMRGGQIHVHGRAGSQVGAALPGARRGMTGGTILIDGDAGDEVGRAMRRGLIAIGGRAGDGLGFNLVAGTILVFGSVGLRAGAGMKRGTIGLFGSPSPALPPTFTRACVYRPQFLGLYFRELAALGLSVPKALRERQFERYCGDHLETGKGEILVPV